MAKTYSCVLVGVDVLIIEIETVLGNGFSGLNILGLAADTTRDMRERVRSALETIGIPIPARRIITNITPSDRIKLSRTPLSQFDFAVAASIIYALFEDKEKEYGRGPHLYKPAQEFFAGELSLSGEVKFISNPLIYEAALGLIKNSSKNPVLCMPLTNQKNTFQIQSIYQENIEFFSHLADWFKQRTETKTTAMDKKNASIPFLNPVKTQQNKEEKLYELTDIFSLLLKNPKLCVAIAVAALGGHHILVAGEPGVGKSFSLQKIIHLLLPLTEKQKIEVKLIHPSANDRQKPFRSPHHSSTAAALIGGRSLKPGEVSLAHHGVLLLDELAEFSRTSLEALREPLDSCFVHLSRAEGTIRYPAQFQLCATTNPCSCGFLFSKKKPCRCNPRDSRKYLQKISGPLLDRFPIQIWVEPSDELESLDLFAQYLLEQQRTGKLKSFAERFLSLQISLSQKENSEENTDVKMQSDSSETSSLSLRGEKMIHKLLISFGLLFPELKNSSNFTSTILGYRELGNMFTKNSLWY